MLIRFLILNGFDIEGPLAFPLSAAFLIWALLIPYGGLMYPQLIRRVPWVGHRLSRLSPTTILTPVYVLLGVSLGVVSSVSFWGLDIPHLK
jgi:hypothetical protein